MTHVVVIRHHHTGEHDTRTPESQQCSCVKCHSVGVHSIALYINDVVAQCARLLVLRLFLHSASYHFCVFLKAFVVELCIVCL